MSKQIELAPLRRGHLILQQAQLKKEAGRPQAASVRVGSAAGPLLQLSQNRWQSPINNQICRLQARPRTIWITQRTRWLSPPAHCESQPRHRLYQHWRYNQHPQRCPRLYESIRSQDTTSLDRWISLHFTCGTSTSTWWQSNYLMSVLFEMRLLQQGQRAPQQARPKHESQRLCSTRVPASNVWRL